jgi:hypothetical protein
MIIYFLLISPFFLIYLLFLHFLRKEKQELQRFKQRHFLLEHGHGGR